MNKSFPKKDDPLDMLFESLLFGVEPSDAIVRSEKRGQQELVKSEVLPKKCLYCTRKQLEQMGIVFGEDADDLFVFVTLPTGWTKKPTPHDMWSKLCDEKGRERAAIFYKAAFYDRDAHISLNSRYHCCVEPVIGWENYHHGVPSEWRCMVKDGEEVIWVSDPIETQPTNYDNRDEQLKWYEKKDKLTNLGIIWLNEHFPKWKDETAYWD